MIDFEKITEFGPFAVIKWKNTVGWPIEFATQNIKEITGYMADDFVSEKLNFYNLLNEQDIKNIDQQIMSAQHEVREQIKLDKYPITHRNGSTVWIEEYVTIVRNELGNVTGYIGYLLNISDRIETELNLEASRNETRALINALPDTILQMSKCGELKQYLEHKSTQDNENKTEVYLSDIFPADFSSSVPQYLEATINDKTISVYEYDKLSLNQQAQHFEARFSEKSDDDALIIIRDITTRRENEKLLKQAMKDVDVANKEKNRFLSNMSHELRTPLNAIMGFSQLLMTDESSDAILAEEIFNAGDHLLTLINDILDISKIEAGKVNLSIEPVPLDAIIDDCVTLIAPLADENGIHFQQFNTTPDISVIADKTRLIQVLLNLLTNAIKYNRKNGQVSLRSEFVNDETLRLEISDTGIGLTPEQIKQLFNPFERVGAENTDVEGTGLGLALSKKLMELMQGKIGVESVPGEGSTFWVTINVSTRDDQEEINAREADTDNSGEQQANVDIEPLSILYIEDNPQNQRLIKTAISTRTPHNLHVAKNGMDGISAATTKSPDIILLDIHLPDISGYEVLKHINSEQVTKNIPVIAISANATNNDLKQARQSNFYQYLTKPINIKQLLDIINKLEKKIRQ